MITPLVFVLLSTFVAASRADVPDHLQVLEENLRVALYQKERRLQTAPLRACGHVITKLLAQEIRALGDVYIGVLLPEGTPETFADQAREFLSGMVNYDVLVTKECSSCDQVKDRAGQGFENYCSQGKYGADATLSHVQMVPIDPETGEIFDNTHQMRGLVAMHQTLVDVVSAPTEVFPSNVSAVLQVPLETAQDTGNLLGLFQDFLTSMVISSSGAIAFIPDNIGYGESHMFNRSILATQPYMQSASVAWLSYEKECGDGPLLEQVATLSGFSEGGFSSLAAAQALQDLGVEILGVHTFAGYLNPFVQIEYVVDIYDKGTIDPTTQAAVLPAIAPFLGFTYSQGYEFLNGRDQILFSKEWTNASNPEKNIYTWFQAGVSNSVFDLVSMAPPFLPDAINQRIINQTRQALMQEDAHLCDEQFVLDGETDELCASLRANDAYTTLETVSFPVILCHSPDDTVVPLSHLPPFPYSNSLVTEYVPVNALLKPQGDHLVSGVFCAMGMIGAVAAAEGTDDANNKFSKDVATCVDPVPTGAPTAGSTSAKSPWNAALLTGLLLGVVALAPF